MTEVLFAVSPAPGYDSKLMVSEVTRIGTEDARRGIPVTLAAVKQAAEAG